MAQTKKSKGASVKKLILRYGLILLIALILGFGLYHWNATTLGNNRLPMPLGFGMTVVLSGSMEPELSVNDMVIVTPQDRYEVGDVVVFQSNSSLTIHRIVDKTEDGMIVTQGDANNTPDDPIPVTSVKGKMVFSIPFVGFLVSFLQSTVGTILILALAIFLYVRSLRNEKAEEKKKLDELREEIEKLKNE